MLDTIVAEQRKQRVLLESIATRFDFNKVQITTSDDKKIQNSPVLRLDLD